MKPSSPAYANQVKHSTLEGRPPEIPGEFERQYVTDLGLWVAHNEFTVLELRAEGWEMVATTTPMTWRTRLDLRMSGLRVRLARWWRRWN